MTSKKLSRENRRIVFKERNNKCRGVNEVKEWREVNDVFGAIVNGIKFYCTGFVNLVFRFFLFISIISINSSWPRLEKI